MERLTHEEIALAGHWADIWAAKVVREKGEKPQYTCASGITPSGTVHIGNFREIISVDLVVRGLRALGKKVRFIYSWDDYDVFRKVPKNMPNPELLHNYLRHSIDAVPDTTGGYASYAAYNEATVEKTLPLVGINPEYLYQSKRYRSGLYAEQMKIALQKRELIRAELDEYRKEPLETGWYPLSIFCENCQKDTTNILSYDDDYGVEYNCESCGHHTTLDLRKTGAAKLPWRVDWPMRWAYEGTDFEPAGKDHHSEGGSFSTAKKTVREIYNHEPPATFQYDFLRIKGGAGKISSSSGEVVDLGDCLTIYQPEVVRFLFAGTRPNSEFAISFDLDVLKIYEDYDKLERTYFDKPDKTDEKKYKKWLNAARTYELSQVDAAPAVMPYQIPIRHLCNLLQINDGNIEVTLNGLPDVQVEQQERLVQRAKCAWNWISDHAPEDFRFKVRDDQPALPLIADELTIVDQLKNLLPLMKQLDENSFAEKLYDLCKQLNIESGVIFTLCYKILLGKEKGPRLISFLYTLGYERVAKILNFY
ncbi:MAG: lysine--tRNA ligase [Spirochaetaceae bacterium]|nr:lysine--tRNA ligase [Spirochaetaceae bacterium]